MLYLKLLFVLFLGTDVERRSVLDKPVMSRSSDNDEIVSIRALATTEIATRETASEMGGSVVENAQNRERSFALKMASIRDD
jgi:hypothetical protein